MWLSLSNTERSAVRLIFPFVFFKKSIFLLFCPEDKDAGEVQNMFPQYMAPWQLEYFKLI